MPELPEVETTKRGLQPHLEKQIIVALNIHNPRLRWPVDLDLAKKLPGLVIRSLKRRAKYLLMETDAGTLLIHLGMSGSLRLTSQDDPLKKHDHIELVLSSGQILRLHDPRRFGAFLWTDLPPEEHTLLRHLGPEPLEDAFDSDYLWRTASTRTASLKSIIMNAQIVVGVGNIYANEALHMAGLSPLMSGRKLTKSKAALLTQSIKHVLARSVEIGGTTLRDFIAPDGTPGYFEQQLLVYGRANEPCKHCQTAIIRQIQNQRATYFCPHCQKG